MNCPYCNAESKPDCGAERSIHRFACGTVTRNESSGRADQTQFCATVERGALFKRIADLEESLDTLTLVVGLTPVRSGKEFEVLQEAFNSARATLAKRGKP